MTEEQEKRICELERELEIRRIIFDDRMTLANEALERSSEIVEKLVAALRGDPAERYLEVTT